MTDDLSSPKCGRHLHSGLFNGDPSPGGRVQIEHTPQPAPFLGKMLSALCTIFAVQKSGLVGISEATPFTNGEHKSQLCSSFGFPPSSGAGDARVFPPFSPKNRFHGHSRLRLNAGPVGIFSFPRGELVFGRGPRTQGDSEASTPCRALLPVDGGY